MRVNKAYFDYFLKENTVFRNGTESKELLRNTTIVSNAENRELTANHYYYWKQSFPNSFVA